MRQSTNKSSIADLRKDLMVMDHFAMTKIMGGRSIDIKVGLNSCGGILPS